MTKTYEVIEGVFTEPWTIDTTFVDAVTWIGCYTNGYREPHYQVPATCEFHMSPELINHWEIAGLIEHGLPSVDCKGLLGECTRCIWPYCERH